MRNKASCLAGGLCCLCAAGILALKTAWPGVEPARQIRPASYAKQVLDDINVVAPEDALGEADGRFAEIRPGGEMTVLMDSRIYYTDGSDDGSVVTKGEGRYGLAGLFRMTEEGEPAWQPLNPGGTPGGFKLGSVMFPVTQSTDTIKIVNDDSRPVFVDAVIGYRKD